jgi:hypothetical protein
LWYRNPFKAQETLYTKEHSKKTELKDFFGRRGLKTNVRCHPTWASRVKEKSRQRLQNEWRSSTSMVTIKPHVNRYKSTESLLRRQQLAVSRLKMSYTNITHGYKIRYELKPHSKECDQELTDKVPQRDWIAVQCTASSPGEK